MKKVLIIQTAFIGDVILATPVISEISRLFPGVQIDFLVKSGNESLVQNNPKISQVITFNKKEGKFKAIRELIRRFRREKYDLVINLHRFGSSGIISGLSGARKRYGFKKNPFSFLYTKRFDHEIGTGIHEVERNLSIIRGFGSASSLRPELFPGSADRDAVAEFQKDEYYVMAPASVWYTKQLPQEKWVELINTLPKSASVYLIGGPGDKELCDSIIESSDHEKILNLCGRFSLLQSAALMQGAKRNFVNDSGPLHLASAMNATVTAFFCSTIPAFGFGPLSDDSQILEVNGLDCRPCGLHGHKECPKGHFKCGLDMEIRKIKIN